MKAKISKLIKKAYSTPPRPAGNLNYMAGTIDALYDSGQISEEERDKCYDLFIDGWSSKGEIPDMEESTKARSLLLSLQEGNIDLGWIIGNVKVKSMFSSGNELTLYTDSTDSLKGNDTFLKEFKRRLFQRGIEGNMTFLREKPAKVLGATDQVNRFVGYSSTRLAGPAHVSGAVTFKMDKQLAQGILDWYK